MSFKTVYELRLASAEALDGVIYVRGHRIMGAENLADAVTKRDSWENKVSHTLRRPIRAEIWANDARRESTGWRFAWSYVA